VKTGKNYEEYLKGTENGEKKKNCWIRKKNTWKNKSIRRDGTRI
jgi:hypothetical protein